MADLSFVPGAEGIPAPPANSNLNDMVAALQGLGQAAMTVPPIASAVHGFEAPYNALNSTGADPYTTTKAMGDAQDMLTLLSGGAPGAEAGAAGIFGGQLAHYAPVESRIAALNAERAGINPSDIYYETGVWRGAGGGLRHEINDSEATPNRNFLTQGGHVLVPDKGVPFSDILNHPEFFKNYPDLGKLPVYPETSGPYGTYWGNKVTIRSGMPTEQFLHTALHEGQHGVQHIENWPNGANVGQFYPEGYTDLRTKLIGQNKSLGNLLDAQGLPGQQSVYDILHYLMGNPETPNVGRAISAIQQVGKGDAFSNWLKAHQLAMDSFEKPAYLQYATTPGELEAENVASRRGLGPAEAAFTLPSETENRILEDAYKRYKPNK